MITLGKQEEQYREVDMLFYRDVVSPLLPERILDFHTHVWKREHWKYAQFDNVVESASLYMVTEYEYSVTQLLEDGKRIFPGNVYEAVCFGQPTPSVNTILSNDYVRQSCLRNRLHPLMIVGKNQMDKEELEAAIVQGQFKGYKVYLNWIGDDYGDTQVSDMIGDAELEVANRLNLIVLLHVPGRARLASNQTQEIIREYSMRYPNISFVLAHCGRCYHPDDMCEAIDAIADLENVYLDTAMVMDPTVIQIVLEEIDSHRLLFATDFPVAVMRGRRVYVMEHWVDVVLEGYPSSAYRICSNNMRATFMAYESLQYVLIAGMRKSSVSRTTLSLPSTTIWFNAATLS